MKNIISLKIVEVSFHFSVYVGSEQPEIRRIHAEEKVKSEKFTKKISHMALYIDHNDGGVENFRIIFPLLSFAQWSRIIQATCASHVSEQNI